MKKALLVTRVSGFVPQHEMNNVKLLQEMGYEVHYAANYNTVVYGKDNHRLDGTGIIRHQIDFCRSPFSREVRRSYRQLKELIRKEEFDLIHCHMPMSAVVTRLAAEKVRKQTGRQVPVLYTAHGFHFLTGAPWRNWLYYPIERFLSRYTDRLILINEEDYRRASRFPVRGKAEQVNGVGLRLESFVPYRKTNWDVPGAEPAKKSDGVDIRQKYGIAPDSCLLVSVGELAPGKNNLLALEAISCVGDRRFSYLICGEGRMEEALRKRAQELELADRVVFAGYVDNTPEILQQCDCFFFPSAREGLPVAMMEAMAVGLPILSSDVRGICDLLEPEKGGYLVHGFAPEDYAQKLRCLFDDGEEEKSSAALRRRMGEWNQKRVEQFSLPVVEQQMRGIYQEIDRELSESSRKEEM